MAKQRGVGPYAGNDVTFYRPRNIDQSGNVTERSRGGRGVEMVDPDQQNDNDRPSRVTDARFGGGAMSRSVGSKNVRRYDPI